MTAERLGLGRGPAREERGPAPRRALRALRVVFGALGLAFLGIAFAATLDSARASVVPSPSRLVGAQMLALVTLFLGARGWKALLPGAGSTPGLGRSFYDAQLGKYIPGVVWQFAAQVGLATHAGVPLRRASAAFAVHALVLVAAAGTIGASLAASRSVLPIEARVASLLGLLGLVLLRRASMLRALRIISRALGRAPFEDVLPPQRAIVGCYAWTVAAFACTAAAFATLASEEASPLTAAAAFAVAWNLGFLAVPFPAGIGIREAVLIGVLASTSSPAPVIAASVLHRLVTMTAEVMMILASRLRRRGGPPRQSDAVTPSTVE